MARDQQRQRLYNAEDALAFGEDLPAVRDIEVYIEGILKKPWFRHFWPHITIIHVGDGRRRSRAGGNPYTRTIKMPKWSRKEKYVLHEIAHVVSPGGEHHGAAFARNFLRLIKHTMGAHIASLFEGSMIGKGCTVNPEDNPFGPTSIAARKRDKPMELSLYGQAYHTHPDNLPSDHVPRWSPVHSRTGLCKYC